MRLNKYVAHCGVCSRRKAVEYIKSGDVQVNGETETIPHRLISPQDRVTFKGKSITPQQEKVYFLLNKPKNVICTMKDKKGRKSLADIMVSVKEQNLHPVGRLDRDATGLLLMTNDELLTQKLAHPSSKVQMIYAVGLDQPLREEDLEQLRVGVTLEDGWIRPDTIDYDRTKDASHIGIVLHGGRNGVIQRMMKHLGYQVMSLDRVYFAGLTKKDLPRGRYRPLTGQEIIRLKHFV